MKLAYNNWHKELVHDDAIQSELTGITKGNLTFTNTPYVKALPATGKPGSERGGYGKPRGKFQQRGGGGGGGGQFRNERNDRGRW